MAKYRMKRGVGGHRMADGRELGPGNLVECGPSDLGGAIDKFDIIEPDSSEEKTQPTEKLIVVKRPNSPIWFDVVNTATGRPINTKALKKDEAEALVERELATADIDSDNIDSDIDSDSDLDSNPNSSDGQ